MSAGTAPAYPAQDHRVVMGLPSEIATPPAPQSPGGALGHPPQTAIRLVLDSGEEYVLSGPTVFGRNPEEDASYGPAHREAVPDDTRSVSKTHFALRPLAGGVEVRDLNSTNGTYLLHESVEREVASGAPLTAVPGDVVRFGDRMIRIGAV